MSDNDRIDAKDYADYEFIANELHRYSALSPTEQFSYLREHSEAAIFGSYVGKRMLPVSKESQKRFVQIAARGLKNLGFDGRLHSLGSVVNELKQQFARGIDVDCSNAHGVFQSVIANLQRTYKETTYYVPCFVVAQSHDRNFTIGPEK